jgi:hypothetical protein
MKWGRHINDKDLQKSVSSWYEERLNSVITTLTEPPSQPQQNCKTDKTTSHEDWDMEDIWCRWECRWPNLRTKQIQEIKEGNLELYVYYWKSWGSFHYLHECYKDIICTQAQVKSVVTILLSAPQIQVLYLLMKKRKI